MSIRSLVAREQGISPTSMIAALTAWIRAGTERSRQRRALGRLSDFDLRDIGLSRQDVEDETAKPFWRM